MNTQCKDVCSDGDVKLCKFTVIIRKDTSRINFNTTFDFQSYFKIKSIYLPCLSTKHTCCKKSSFCHVYFLQAWRTYFGPNWSDNTKLVRTKRRLTSSFNHARNPNLTTLCRQMHVPIFPMYTGQRHSSLSHNGSEKANTVWKYITIAEKYAYITMSNSKIRLVLSWSFIWKA